LVARLAAHLVGDQGLRAMESVLVRREEAHAVALEPEEQGKLLGRNVHDVARGIDRRGRVVAGAPRALEPAPVLAVGHVARAVEHHVLDEMGESLLAGRIVAGADVVAHDDGGVVDRGVGCEHDVQSVGEHVLLDGKGERRQVARIGVGAHRQREEDSRREQGTDVSRRAQAGPSLSVRPDDREGSPCRDSTWARRKPKRATHVGHTRRRDGLDELDADVAADAREQSRPAAEHHRRDREREFVDEPGA
jgi:hypothetical protein